MVFYSTGALNKCGDVTYIHPLYPNLICSSSTGEFIPRLSHTPVNRQDVDGDQIDDSLCIAPSSVPGFVYPIGIPCGDINETATMCSMYRCDGTGVCRRTADFLDVYFETPPHFSILAALFGIGLSTVSALAMLITLIYMHVKNQQKK